MLSFPEGNPPYMIWGLQRRTRLTHWQEEPWARLERESIHAMMMRWSWAITVDWFNWILSPDSLPNFLRRQSRSDKDLPKAKDGRCNAILAGHQASERRRQLIWAFEGLPIIFRGSGGHSGKHHSDAPLGGTVSPAARSTPDTRSGLCSYPST